MRNLAEYPVTKGEILDYLYSLLDDLHEAAKEELMCGDMRMTYVSEIIKIVEEKENYEFDFGYYDFKEEK